MRKREFVVRNNTHSIHVYEWLPNIEPLAVIQVVHGASEHGARYEKFAKFLVSRGFAVYSSDHRGHGKCSKDKGSVYFGKENGWIKMIKDLYAVTQYIKEQYQDKKLILLGHSMGSILARGYITYYSEWVDGVILTGSFHPAKRTIEMGSSLANHSIKRGKGTEYNRALDYMSFKSFNIPFLKEKDELAWLSCDKKSRDEYRTDELCGKYFSGYAFRDLFEGVALAIDESEANKIRKDLPIYILSGEQDPVGANGKQVKKIYDMYKRVGIKEVSLKLYPNMRHEILNETEKQKVYKDILEWIREKYKKV